MNFILNLTLGLILTLSFFSNVSAAVTNEETSSLQARPVSSRFSPQQQEFLKELGLSENHEEENFSATALKLTVPAVEEDLIGKMIVDAAFQQNIFRGEDGSLQMRLIFSRGDACIDLTNWRKNTKKIAQLRQNFSHLFGSC